MENFEKKLNNEENLLNNFREEIKDIQSKEKEEKQDEANYELMSIDPDDLDEKDLEMWQWYKNLNSDNITREDMSRIREYAYSVKKDDSDRDNSSRNNYLTFLSDKIMPIWRKKEVRDLEENKKNK